MHRVYHKIHHILHLRLICEETRRSLTTRNKFVYKMSWNVWNHLHSVDAYCRMSLYTYSSFIFREVSNSGSKIFSSHIQMDRLVGKCCTRGQRTLLTYQRQITRHVTAQWTFHTTTTLQNLSAMNKQFNKGHVVGQHTIVPILLFEFIKHTVL